MARSILVENKLLLRYEDDDDDLKYNYLNTSLLNDEIYQTGQAIASLQDKTAKSINKLTTYRILP